MKLSQLSPVDFDETLSLWDSTLAMGMSGLEDASVLATFFAHNPGLSFKVTDRDRIVGTILCGHDGRRGFLHHLAVAPGYSGRKVGKTLLDRTLSGLEHLGIERCHIFVASGNRNGREAWKSTDWEKQKKLAIFTHDIEYPVGG